MRILFLLVLSTMLINRAIAQPTISVSPGNSKLMLSGDGGGITTPTHVDVYRGLSDDPDVLYTTFIPSGYNFLWEDTLVEDGQFYFYRVRVRDENAGSLSAFSNQSTGLADDDGGSSYQFNGVNGELKLLDEWFNERITALEFDFKIDELTAGKNTEIYRMRRTDEIFSNEQSILTIFHTADELRLYMRRSDNTSSFSEWTFSTHDVADGKWHHLRITQLNNSTIIVYLDDVQYNFTINGTLLFMGDHDIIIGGRNNAGTNYLKGGFDEIMISGASDETFGHWRLDEPSARRTVYDSGPSQRDMTKFGGVVSENDLFQFQAISTNTNSNIFKPLTDSNPNITSLSLSRTVLPSGPTVTLNSDISQADFSMLSDQLDTGGVPYEYTIDYTVSIYDGSDSPFSTSDIVVSATGLGNHYTFDGVDDVVTLARPVIKNTAGTVEFLVKIAPEDRPSGFSYALMGKQNNANRNGFVVLHDGSRIWCQFRDGLGNNSNLYPIEAINLTDGIWHHVALTFSVGNSATLYVDGESVVTASVNDFNFTSASLLIGKSSNTFWTPLKGSMDEVVIWDRVLSTQEIRNRAFAKVRGDTEGLLASYHFDEVSGLTAYDGGLNNDHASVDGATIGLATENIPIHWKGTSNSDWNQPANWNIGTIPEAHADLEITAAGSAAVISGQDTASVNDLLINSGASLTVESGGILAIHGDATIDGSYTVKRNPEANRRYSMVGSPMSDADVSDFGADLTVGYDPLTATFTEEAGTAFPGNGYFVSYFENDPEIVLSGNPNTGNVSVPLTISLESPISYNLVANPYAAPIDYDIFANANGQAITGAIWLWDDGGANNSGKRFGGYTTVNSLGAVTSSAGMSGSTWNGYIGSFQGFFVRTNTDGNLQFTPEMQVTEQGANNDDHHFRIVESDSPVMIKLALRSKEYYNETMIAFTDKATAGEDPRLDAPNLKGNPDFAFYSWINDEPYAIQGLPMLEPETDSVSVTLGYDIGESNEFEILVVEMQNNPSRFQMVLKDHELNIEYVLSENSGIPLATLSAEHGSKRFELAIRNTVITSSENDDLQRHFSVYGSTDQLTINYPSNSKEKVTIYSLDGSKVFEDHLEFQQSVRINPSLSQHQLYILKIRNDTMKFILE